MRIEKVVDLSSMWSSLQDLRRIPEQLEEVIDDSFDDKGLHASMKPFMDLLAPSDDDEGDSLMEQLQSLPMRAVDVIFMQGATPARKYHSPTCWGSGWGHYYTRWVMAKTYSEGWAMLVAWAREMHDKDMAAAPHQAQEAQGDRHGD